MEQEDLRKQQVIAEWPVINAMARRRFGETSLAEEAALAVMDGLAADNWARIRRYQGRSTFQTFLKMVVARLLEDYSRKKFGRLRPPGWVKVLGGCWLQMFIALCQQRLSMAEAVETVRLRVVERLVTPGQLEDAGYEILSRIPHCGSHQYVEEEFTGEQMGDCGEEESRQGISDVEEREERDILAAVFLAIVGYDEAGSSQLPEEKLGSISRKFRELTFVLGSEEKLLLKLCYQDGLEVSVAGRLLSLNRFQAHGRLKRLLARLRDEFERVGLAEELRLLLKK